MTLTAHRTAPARGADRPFALVRHSLVLAGRSLVKTARTPEQLLDVTLQPAIFVVVFVYLLGGAVAGSTHGYLQLLLPAIMVQSTVFAGVATGVNLNADIGKGVFDRFRSLPIGRSAPLVGSVLGDLVRYVAAVVSLLLFGALMGFRVTTGLLPALAACLLAILFAFSLSWAFVLVGMLARTPGSVQGIGFLALFPLTFGTSMIAPAETLPGWLRSWVEVNPVTHVMTAARGLMVGGPVAGSALWALLWSAVFVAVFAPLAVRAYRRRA
ncbi:ABC transporter permease [Saccharothrix algeriensis]|uniref:Transport permease protein n=1 Tax=Saccharothrix algeriensis TaxID=173560 RepID=A0ABS2RZR1_9PSEU|nr:ABC transporter permease [Saccharothrix algeriensis]MBM7809190.1 oleandomycin transport system permease protein [Saccharothrix algeriensis]